MNRTPLAIALSILPAAAAVAQTPIDPAHKFCWQENTGWLNWADAAQPVRVGATILSGFIWSENVGWINVGDGTPASGTTYGNTTGADAGVNIAADGRLYGLAWGENVGWINFDTIAALGTQAARLDRVAGRLRGWAWGENIGWVNLDDINNYVGVGSACYANCDGSTSTPALTVNDFICFQSRFAAGDPYANCDGSTSMPTLTVNDFICFQSRFAAGCP
jgi:hypothetical protein